MCVRYINQDRWWRRGSYRRRVQWDALRSRSHILIAAAAAHVHAIDAFFLRLRARLLGDLLSMKSCGSSRKIKGQQVTYSSPIPYQ